MTTHAASPGMCSEPCVAKELHGQSVSSLCKHHSALAQTDTNGLPLALHVPHSHTAGSTAGLFMPHRHKHVGDGLHYEVRMTSLSARSFSAPLSFYGTTTIHVLSLCGT